MENDFESTLPPIDPWPIGDDLGMRAAIHMLKHSLETGKNDSAYVQFDSVRPTRAMLGDIYKATYEGNQKRQVLKASKGVVLHMFDGPTQSSFLERVMRGMKARMPEKKNRDSPISSRIVLYLLNSIQSELNSYNGLTGDRPRELIMAAGYVCVAFGYSLRGNEAFWVDADRLIKHIELGREDPNIPHIVVPILGKFKGEDGDRMHLLPIASKSASGIEFRYWIELAATVVKSERKTKCPLFCDRDGYILSSSHIEDVLHPILEELQQEQDPDLKNLIPNGLNVREKFRCYRSFRRGASSQATDNNVKEQTITLVNRWHSFESGKGKEPTFDMLNHYIAGADTRKRQLSFSASL